MLVVAYIHTNSKYKGTPCTCTETACLYCESKAWNHSFKANEVKTWPRLNTKLSSLQGTESDPAVWAKLKDYLEGQKSLLKGNTRVSTQKNPEDYRNYGSKLLNWHINAYEQNSRETPDWKTKTENSLCKYRVPLMCTSGFPFSLWIKWIPKAKISCFHHAMPVQFC